MFDVWLNNGPMIDVVAKKKVERRAHLWPDFNRAATSNIAQGREICNLHVHTCLWKTNPIENCLRWLGSTLLKNCTKNDELDPSFSGVVMFSQPVVQGTSTASNRKSRWYHKERSLCRRSQVWSITRTRCVPTTPTNPTTPCKITYFTWRDSKPRWIQSSSKREDIYSFIVIVRVVYGGVIPRIYGC